MAKLVVSLLGLASLIAGGAIVWISAPTTPPPPLPPPPWTTDMQAVAKANNRFAIDLYGKLRQKPGNLFFSPFSAHAALVMTSFGANGTTRTEMLKVLYLPGNPETVLGAGDLGRFYSHPRKEYELSVANAIWGQTGYPWRQEFLDQAQRFGAGLNEAHFISAPDAERVRINDWAEKQTRGKIRDLLREGLITPRTRMVLTNAINFKGEWDEKFDQQMTIPLPFTRSDGTETDIPMMRRTGGFRFYNQLAPAGQSVHRNAILTNWQPEFQVAEIPYRGGDLSMVVLLPGKHDGLPALEAKLSADSLTGWLRKAQDAKLNSLYLPRFRLEMDAMMLNDPLIKIGMVAAFDPTRADLTGLHSSDEELHIDFVVQKAFIEISEAGRETTPVQVYDLLKRLAFCANRPFLFLIRDMKHGTILFLGRIEDPSPLAGSNK